MTISLDEPRTPGTPVVKRQRLGETFVGAIVRKEQRDVLKDGQPVLNDKGKPRQELVLHCLTMPGTTSPAGIGDHTSTPAPGEPVRLILRGGGFGQFIEAQKAHGALVVGDVVTQVTEWAQAYDAAGRPTGPKMTVQAQVDAVPRQQAVGVYGTLTLRSATPAEATWVQAAEAAYLATQRTPVDSTDDGGW